MDSGALRDSKTGRSTILAMARRRPSLPTAVTACAMSTIGCWPARCTLLARRMTSVVSTTSFEIRSATSTAE